MHVQQLLGACLEVKVALQQHRSSRLTSSPCRCTTPAVSAGTTRSSVDQQSSNINQHNADSHDPPLSAVLPQPGQRSSNAIAEPLLLVGRRGGRRGFALARRLRVPLAAGADPRLLLGHPPRLLDGGGEHGLLLVLVRRRRSSSFRQPWSFGLRLRGARVALAPGRDDARHVSQGNTTQGDGLVRRPPSSLCTAAAIIVVIVVTTTTTTTRLPGPEPLPRAERLLDGAAPRLDLLLAPPADDADGLRVGVDGGAQAAEGAHEGDGVGLVDGARHGDEVDELLGVRARLGAPDGGEAGVLVRLVQLQVARGLGGGPAEDEGGAVDEGGLGQLAEGVLVVRDVDHGQEDAEVVAALEVADAGVDVFGVEAVVLQAVFVFVVVVVSCWMESDAGG